MADKFALRPVTDPEQQRKIAGVEVGTIIYIDGKPGAYRVNNIFTTYLSELEDRYIIEVQKLRPGGYGPTEGYDLDQINFTFDGDTL